jgi:hypothetical protein
LGKAINAYFELKFKVGNPKYKQVVQQVPIFRNLSILAKTHVSQLSGLIFSQMVNNFEMIKLGIGQRYPIPDVNKVDFYFVMEGRLRIKCSQMNLKPDDSPSDTTSLNSSNAEIHTSTLIANDVLTKQKIKDINKDGNVI